MIPSALLLPVHAKTRIRKKRPTPQKSPKRRNSSTLLDALARSTRLQDVARKGEILLRKIKSRSGNPREDGKHTKAVAGKSSNPKISPPISEDSEPQALELVKPFLHEIRELLQQARQSVSKMFPRLREEPRCKMESAAVERSFGELLTHVRVAYVNYYKVQDQELNNIIRQMKAEAHGKNEIERYHSGAIKTLRRLSSKKTPGAKLRCLLKAFKRVTEAEEKLEEKQEFLSKTCPHRIERPRSTSKLMSCDRMCDTFQSLLVSAMVPNIIWQVHFTYDLMRDEDVGAAGDYILTTLLGLIHLLKHHEETKTPTHVDTCSEDLHRRSRSPLTYLINRGTSSDNSLTTDIPSPSTIQKESSCDEDNSTFAIET
eukprot:CAMPEP_0184493214 /NCGR_PEP_ID=MMETSP0113_2-20130426/25435_1 /TAXON_ID=91329 /ORGANISM="Norrisiella sphaerica, Strain BC52" /LENGTH=371 /DNA_ID=CAMNT_0026878405 /DNA_START=110 /DNA_END=1225 /DNA_ORIENTATION=-